MGIYIELNNFEVSKRLIFLKAEVKYGAPNYAEMIDELKKYYEMTHEKIAYLLPLSGASGVADWAHSVTPNYEAGEAFIELWKALTDKTDKDIPRVNNWSV
ncbi:hypothetical protein ABLT80_03945 [Acinetobacter schindleri]|uniref:hypothetical protein n=1 Tax=Acinetobacter schindleri TaxID=108981 RepID=UPI0032B36A50